MVFHLGSWTWRAIRFSWSPEDTTVGHLKDLVFEKKAALGNIDTDSLKLYAMSTTTLSRMTAILILNVALKITLPRRGSSDDIHNFYTRRMRRLKELDLLPLPLTKSPISLTLLV